MYISSDNCFRLDEIIKGFEVAYRSFVSETIKIGFPNEEDFNSKISELGSKFDSTSIMFSKKYKNKLRNIQKKCSERYSSINNCYQSMLTCDYDNDVPYVSDLIDYIVLFFNPCFESKGILNGFSSVEEFNYLNEHYRLIRNALSHPASSKVLIEDASKILLFIEKLTISLNDKYFWYVQKNDIHQQIKLFLENVESNPLKINNLKEINFLHRKLVCRDHELEILKKLIIGTDEYQRVSGSTLVYGYGGVGKTAIVIEFIFELIKYLKDSKYDQPYDFILFFSSKDEMLRFSETTGSFYIDQMTRQISSFSDFEKKLFSYLEVNR